MKIVVVDSPQHAASSAAEWMARRIASAVQLRGQCRLAVSGGSTPALMFDDLATMDLPWSSVHVFQVDERVAPDGDPQRNAGQLAAHLTDLVPVRRANVHLMPVTARSLARAAATYAAKLGDQRLDIVHLGLGDDGHTASWPPGDDVIDAPGLVGVSGMFNGCIRMTVTPAVVNGARSRMVLAVGTAKAAPIAGWIRRAGGLPIERVKRTDTTLIIDTPAAGELSAAELSAAELSR